MSNDYVVSLETPAGGLRSTYGASSIRGETVGRRRRYGGFRAEYLSVFGHEKVADGRQWVVRNGHLPERKVLTGLGEVDVRPLDPLRLR